MRFKLDENLGARGTEILVGASSKINRQASQFCSSGPSAIHHEPARYGAPPAGPDAPKDLMYSRMCGQRYL